MAARAPGIAGSGWVRVAALVVVPVAAFAAASRSRVPSAPAAGAAASTPITVTAAVLMVLAAGGAITLVVGMLCGRGRRHDGEDEPQHVTQLRFSRRSRGAGLAVAVLAVAVVPVLAVTAGHLGGSQPVTGQHAAGTPASRPAPAGDTPRARSHPAAPTGNSSDTAYLLAGIAVAAAAIGILAYRRRTGRPATSPSQDPLAATLDAGIQHASRAVAGTDDVRRAIIGCFTAMQDGLDRSGLPRSEVRTPAELLAAATRAGLAAPGPATTLTRLFERARFSSADLTDRDRQTAATALAGLRRTGVRG